MKLIYTPKEGFAGPPLPWPARDHTERRAKVAAAKIASGFYRRDRRVQKPGTAVLAEPPAGGKD